MSDSVLKAQSSKVTLYYAAAAVSVLGAVFTSLILLGQLFQLWTVGNAFATVVGGYSGTVTLAVLASFFALLSFFLYRRVTRQVAESPDYLSTNAYHFITNALVGLLALALVVTVANLVSVLISSLLLIGTNADIGGMYLREFLPGLVAAGFIGFTGFWAVKIMQGKNVSFVLGLMLLSVAAALLLATLITVPIKAHNPTPTPTPLPYPDYTNYLN